MDLLRKKIAAYVLVAIVVEGVIVSGSLIWALALQNSKEVW